MRVETGVVKLETGGNDEGVAKGGALWGQKESGNKQVSVTGPTVKGWARNKK